MRIAVVGDVHGHLALLYAILGRWQRETGRTIDLVLQVGDLGAFPAARVDQATNRHAARDPEELGFAEFAGENPPATLLDPRPPLVFIPGNHEDFDYLEACERGAPGNDPRYPVSADRLILALRSGRVWSFEAAGESVRIAGVSGVVAVSQKKQRDPRIRLRDEDAQGLAKQGPGSIGILISHERPAQPGIEARLRHDLGGSIALSRLIEQAQPRLAFFGHYDRASEWNIGRTRVMGLTGCGYLTRGDWPIKRDGIVIVEWKGATATAEWLHPEWLAGATRDNWRHWETPA